MGDTNPSPDLDRLNRAGRRAAERQGRRLRKAGAALATVPAALGTTALVLGATAAPAGAAELVVKNLNATGADSLHDLVEGAGNGDVIVFEAGLSGTIFLDDVINIDTSVTIRGPGSGVITVSGDTGNNGSADVQIFDIDGPGPANLDVEISGLTLTMGMAIRGAAVNFDYANLTVRDAVISGNSTTSSGGGIASDADSSETLTIENTLVTGNTAGAEGGGVYFYAEDGTFSMTGSQVTDNESGSGGGGLWIGAEQGTQPIASVAITGSTISGNTAGAEGGGLYVYYVTGDVTVTASVISGNSANGGGGGLWISHVDGTTTIDGTTVSSNSSTADGGGAYLRVLSGGTTISNSTFDNNVTPLDGGGIEWIHNDALLLRNSTLSGNTAGRGGGMYISSANYDLVQIVNSTISGNTATGGDQGYGGGGIWHASYYGLDIIESTITDNTGEAGNGVGGIQIKVWGERAASSAVANDDRAAARRAEKEAHHAEKGVAVSSTGPSESSVVRAADFSPVTLIGVIVTDNIGLDIGEEGTVAATSSLLGTVSGTTLVDGGGNLFGVDPLLGPLADNGGPTQTHELLPGSPAIDAGPDPLPAFPGDEFDQRGPGYARVVAGRVDIGAFEVQPPPELEPTFTG